MNARLASRLVLPLALLLAMPACAGELAVTDAWARATPPGSSVAAVYLVIDNQAPQPDRLLKLRSSIAPGAEVHGTSVEGGMTRMRPVTVLHIGAGERVAFEAGGLHVMLFGLKKPLVAGQTFTMEFVFELAGTRQVAVTVRD